MFSVVNLFVLVPCDDGQKNIYTNKQKVGSKENIIVVIDPGHGGTSGNTGSVYRKSYFHKVKGTSGEPEIDPDGKFVIVETAIDSLPEYVYDEVRLTDDSSKWKWADPCCRR